MKTLSKVDYTSYSDDELEQAIKDIQKVKISRETSHSNKQKIFIKTLSNQENESLSKDQNMLKTYVIGYLARNNGQCICNGYALQDNNNDACLVARDFNPFTNSHYKNSAGDSTRFGFLSVDDLISFSYNEI